LLAAELAEGEDGDAGGPAGGRARLAPALGHLAQGDPQGDADGGVGDGRQVAGDFFQRPVAQDVGGADAEQGPAAGAAGGPGGGRKARRTAESASAASTSAWSSWASRAGGGAAPALRTPSSSSGWVASRSARNWLVPSRTSSVSSSRGGPPFFPPPPWRGSPTS